MDAWEILTANATDTSSAWAALNSQGSGGISPGLPVDELKFTLSPVVDITGAISIQSSDGAIGVVDLASSVVPADITGSINTYSITGTIEVGDI